VVEPSLVAGEALTATIDQPERADILGAGDEALVTLRPVMRVGIDKTKVPAEDAAASARALADLVGIDPQAYADAVEKAGPKAFVEAIVLREADAAEIGQAAVEAIPGAVGKADELPLAPTRDFAPEILGRVGPATAEVIEESGGVVLPGEEVGLSGLQARYDEQLGGQTGITVAAVADDQRRPLHEVAPAAGTPLRTTLDADLQRAAEAALAGVGPASALVAIRPSTGDILAAANGEGSDGYSTATVGQYAPGSTMKVATSLALLRAGVAPTDPVPCTESIVVTGKAFTNYDDYPASGLGDIPLRTAVANSCNTALISQRDELPEGALAEAAAALGLGVDHDLGFPAYFGQVPVPASETEEAASLIGQGKVLSSPLAMAAVAASVAEGRTVVPRLLPDIASPEADPTQPLTAEEAEALRDMMRAVVTQGTAGFLRDVPGDPVLAKTGTAEFGTGNPPDTHAWMIASQGDLAVAVFVEEGESGSQTAGPILEEFLRTVRVT
jgi:cell division protein FtsI/penicillin-binding protein 2